MAKITKSNPFGRGRESLGSKRKVNTNLMIEGRIVDALGGKVAVRNLAADFIEKLFNKLKN